MNMFVIPAGMMLGANVSFADWWIWNGIPVLLGNVIGGALFTGLLIYLAQNGFRASRPVPTVTVLSGHGEGAIAKTAIMEKSL